MQFIATKQISYKLHEILKLWHPRKIMKIPEEILLYNVFEPKILFLTTSTNLSTQNSSRIMERE